MKGILRFDLSDPDDAQEFRRAQRAGDYLTCLEDVAGWLRSKTKYATGQDEKLDEAYEKLSEEFWEIMKTQNVDPYEE